MNVRRRIFGYLLTGWGVFCLCLFIAERVTGQVVLIKSVRLKLDDFLFVLLCLLCAGAVSFLIRTWCKTVRKSVKALLVCGWIGVISGLLLGSLIWLGRHAVTTWHEFDSPDQQYSLVAGESTFLLLGNIRLYERTSPIFIRELDATLFPDDGFAAIARGAYEISWVGDVVTLSVDQNCDDMWESVTLDMADDGKVLASYSYYPDGRPDWRDEQEKTSGNEDTESGLADAEQADEYPDEGELQIINGLLAVARTVGDAGVDEANVTYTAKGTPEFVISSDSEAYTYILYDRESTNGKCALYVLYQSATDKEGDSDPQIMEMYAYEYASGKVIMAGRHAWSDIGTDEYRKATGE